MAIRTNVDKREQWFVKNISSKILTVGDLPKLPTFNPGDEYDLLSYHDKNQISNSADLTTLSSFGWITITKKKDDEITTHTEESDINDSIATAEEDEVDGSGSGGAGTAKVSSDDTTAGYLDGKLVAGTNVTFVVGSGGGNETLTISSSGSGGTIATENSGVSVDTTADTLNFGTGLTASDAGSGQTDIVLASHTHTESDVTDLSHTTNAALLVSGVLADARVQESNVTQHETALTITESQISDLTHTTDSHVDVSNIGSTVVSDAATLDFDTKFAVTDGGGSEADITVDEPDLTIWNLVVNGNQLLEGGATWDSGLTFNTNDLLYVIDGVIYSAAADSVTLTAADGSNDRIDVIVADNLGVVSVITGTANANPVKPDIDEDTEVEITFVSVAAGASTPTLSVNLIYDEDAGSPTEWNATTSDAEFNLSSASDPFNDTVSIEATAAASNDRVTFTASTLQDLTAVNLLEFNIKSKAVWPNEKRVQLWFTLGGARVSNRVNIRDQGNTFNFDSSDTSAYQSLSINKVFFKLTSNVVDGMVMRVRGSGGTIGFFADRIRWQEGVPTATLQPNWLSILSDDGVTTADSDADTLQLLGDGGSADAHIRTSIVDDTVTFTLNRTLIENHIPVHLIGGITTNSDLYKSLMGYGFKYRFTGPGIITKIVARQGTVDSGASQATVDVNIDSTSALDSAITLADTADTDVVGVLSSGTDIVISEGDLIELDVNQGTNGDAEDLAVDIVFTTTLQR